jgi:hypothetical protein
VLLQCCYSVVTVILQGCYSVVTVLLQCCYSDLTVLLQCCYSVVTVLLQCCYSVVTVLLQCCYQEPAEARRDEDVSSHVARVESVLATDARGILGDLAASLVLMCLLDR